MGQRQDKDEIVYGDDCLAKFDAGETPKYVYARFIGIEQCPGKMVPPNDHVFKLTQHETNHCYWFYHSEPLWVGFQFSVDPPGSSLHMWLTDPPGGYLFDSQEFFHIDEGHVFDNSQNACAGEAIATGGIGIITWRLETISILESLNLETAYDLFMEMRPLDDGSRVYKYCKLQDGTNIKVKYDPT